MVGNDNNNEADAERISSSVVKIGIVILLIALLILFRNSLQIEGHSEVNKAPDGCIIKEVELQISEEKYKELQSKSTNEHLNLTKKEQGNKILYYVSTSYIIEQQDAAENLMEFNKDCFVEYANDVGASGYESDTDSSYEYKYVFPYKILSTNGAIVDDEGYTVDFSGIYGKRYAIFSQSAMQDNKISLNLPNFTKASNLRINSIGTKELRINGTKISPFYHYQSGRLIKDEYTFSKEGKYMIDVILINGNKVNAVVVYDKTQPTISRSGKKLIVKDAGGIKSVSVDGKKINLKTFRFKKFKKYKVIAVDKAGNKVSKTIKYKE